MIIAESSHADAIVDARHEAARAVVLALAESLRGASDGDLRSLCRIMANREGVASLLWWISGVLDVSDRPKTQAGLVGAIAAAALERGAR